MNHATGAVTPLDQEMVQVGHSIWQRAERRCLIQGPVRPVVVVAFTDGRESQMASDLR